MKIRSRLLTRLAAWLSVALMRIVFRSCRVRLVAKSPGISPYVPPGDERYLFAGWHDQILLGVFATRSWSTAALVSQHQDGSYLAEAMRCVGITPIRGSTRRGGARALREMLDRAREFHIAITPDGPRGPRHELKPGLMFLASHSGRAIVPIACDCRKGWRVQGSWTDMLIPRPFTEIVLLTGTPFLVPDDLTREQLDGYSRRFHAELTSLQDEVAQLARGDAAQSIQERRAAA